MAGITNQRLKEMEEEMNRFEHEISMPVPLGERGHGIGNTTQFVPHQLARGAMNHSSGMEQGSNMYASGEQMSKMNFSQPNMRDLPNSTVAPAVYSARPVKTVQPSISNQGTVYTVPASPPPLAPPPPPPMAINYLNASHSQSNNDSNKSSQNDHYSSSASNKNRDSEHNEPTTPPVYAPSVTLTSVHMANMNRKPSKKKKIVRVAGNQVWEDNSLLEWDPDDFRIFCGDLGNDVTDEVLVRTFGRYPSFVKAKVVRDKRTNKTKGFGFVSFKDPQDFIKAMREMNGKYVGSRPIKLRKSTWKDRNIEIVKKKQKEKERLGLA